MRCPFCGAEEGNRARLAAHVARSHSRLCPCCGRPVRGGLGLYRHAVSERDECHSMLAELLAPAATGRPVLYFDGELYAKRRMRVVVYKSCVRHESAAAVRSVLTMWARDGFPGRNEIIELNELLGCRVYRPVSIKMPPWLVDAIDAYAYVHMLSRSDVIRAAVAVTLSKRGVLRR